MKKSKSESFWHAMAIGTVAAATIVLIDSTVTRVPSLNATGPRRATGRIALAGVGAGAAMLMNAPDAIPEGILAGAMAVTLIDAGLYAIGNKRIEPPRIVNAAQLGDLWLPQPMMAIR